MAKQLSPEIEQQVREALYAGNKIAAIKVYREGSDLGLKESKDAVEALETELRAKEPTRFTRPAGKGCLGVVLVFMLTAVVASIILVVRLG